MPINYTIFLSAGVSFDTSRLTEIFFYETEWKTPHFVHGQLAEVYFYGEAGSEYALPEIETLNIEADAYFSVNSNTIEGVGYNNVIRRGEYPVITIPHDDSTPIRCVPFYEEYVY